MPFINVIRGERIEPAPLNVRTPIVRVPMWMALFWWTVKGLTLAVVLACRYWYVTAPAALLGWLYAEFDWYGPAGLFSVLAAVVLTWYLTHPASCARFVWWPVLGRWRRLCYRRRWLPAMVTARLTVRYDGNIVAPVLLRVRSDRYADVLTVRMVTGQIPDDYAQVGERLARTFGALGIRVVDGPREDQVVLVLRRRDPLHAVLAPIPPADVPDFTALPIGLTEEGEVYRLRLFGTQILVVGATDAGKGSVVWSIICALAGGIRKGTVKVWGLDPKGGMELRIGAALFDRLAYRDFEVMADMLEALAVIAQDRAERLGGITRQHIPTVDEPLYLLVIDELGALTAYLTDRRLKDRIKAALGILLSQGRAVGVHVVACLQDPRKETLPARNLFPTRIALRLSEDSEVDMTLGDGSRDRGALCDRIPKGPTGAGIGYVLIDGDPTPMRLRFTYLADDDIRALARDYGQPGVIDREVA